jgi:hypothetical protein
MESIRPSEPSIGLMSASNGTDIRDFAWENQHFKDQLSLLSVPTRSARDKSIWSFLFGTEMDIAATQTSNEADPRPEENSILTAAPAMSCRSERSATSALEVRACVDTQPEGDEMSKLADLVNELYETMQCICVRTYGARFEEHLDVFEKFRDVLNREVNID